jgi:HEAT repeat protein
MNRYWAIGGVALVVIVALGLLLEKSPFYITKLIPEKDSSGHGSGEYLTDLESPDILVRGKALHALGTFGPDVSPQVVDKVGGFLSSKDPMDRTEASMALVKMVPASKTAFPAIAKAVEDPEALVRYNAITTIIRLGAPDSPGMKPEEMRAAVPGLIKATKDKSNDTNLELYPDTIKSIAALALARASKGTTEGVKPLMQFLEELHNDKSIDLKGNNRGKDASKDPKKNTTPHNSKHANSIIRPMIMCARALGELGPDAKEAVPLLKKIMEDQEKVKIPIVDFNKAALDAITEIEGKTASAK